MSRHRHGRQGTGLEYSTAWKTPSATRNSSWGLVPDHFHSSNQLAFTVGLGGLRSARRTDSRPPNHVRLLNLINKQIVQKFILYSLFTLSGFLRSKSPCNNYSFADTLRIDSLFHRVILYLLRTLNEGLLILPQRLARIFNPLLLFGCVVDIFSLLILDLLKL